MTVFILYCMIETARELRDFRLTKYRICSPKLNGIRGTKKIIFLSDLHNRMYGKENERLLKSIKNQHPDLILIGGDMLVRKDGNSYDRTVRFLEKLPAICPVYCANGNHEQKLKELRLLLGVTQHENADGLKRRIVVACTADVFVIPPLCLVADSLHDLIHAFENGEYRA